MARVVENATIRNTMLTAFYDINRQHARLEERGLEIDPLKDPRRLLYVEMPERFTWDKQRYCWKPRQRSHKGIGRLVFIGPSAGDIFYLRLLLTHVRGPTSPEALRTVGGNLLPWKEACAALGLLDDDKQWDLCLREVCPINPGNTLRALFAMILLECAPAAPRQLWDRYRQYFRDDCRQMLTNKYFRAIPDDEHERIREEESLALYLINIRLEQGSQPPNIKNLGTFGLPWPHIDFDEVLPGGNRLLHEERQNATAPFDAEQQWQRLNAEQLIASTAIVEAVNSGGGGVFFLGGCGGSGKTFVENTVLAKVRSTGKIALAIASSGIAATLLDGGRTAHSRFKIPIDIEDTTVCNIRKGTHLGDLMNETVLLIWDEAPMQHKFCMHSVDRMFRDIKGQADKPFGGIVVCFCGDFRQTLPIIQGGLPAAVIDACLRRSYLWDNIRLLILTTNMRLSNPNLTEEGRRRMEEFAAKVLQVGERTGPGDRIHWAENGLEDNTIEGCYINSFAFLTANITIGLIDYVYPPGSLPSNVAGDFLGKRAILATTNHDVASINDSIVRDRAMGQLKFKLSADVPVERADRDVVGPEILNGVENASLPPHSLCLKEGCPVMCLRNLDPVNGLCNGTRLQVNHIGDHFLRCTILGGKHQGKVHLLPRIPLQSPDNDARCPYSFKRTQFPVRLAYAMTINKSQGQTLEKVGIDLKQEVFSHGQLYTAFTRTTSGDSIGLVVPDNLRESRLIKNVVWRQVLQD
jgi:PIF1-like helicase